MPCVEGDRSDCQPEQALLSEAGSVQFIFLVESSSDIPEPIAP